MNQTPIDQLTDFDEFARRIGLADPQCFACREHFRRG